MRNLAEMERQVEDVTQQWRALSSHPNLRRRPRPLSHPPPQPPPPMDRRPATRHSPHTAVDWVVLPPWYDAADDEDTRVVEEPRPSDEDDDDMEAIPALSPPPPALHRPVRIPAPSSAVSLSPSRIRSHLRLLRRPRRSPAKPLSSPPHPPPNRFHPTSSTPPVAQAPPRQRFHRLLRSPLKAQYQQQATHKMVSPPMEERREEDLPPTSLPEHYPAPSASFLNRVKGWQTSCRHRRQALTPHTPLHSSPSHQLPTPRPAVRTSAPRPPPPVPPTALLTTHSSLLSFSHRLSTLLSHPTPPSTPTFHPSLIPTPYPPRIQRTLVDRSLADEHQRRQTQSTQWTMGHRTRQLLSDREYRRMVGETAVRRRDEGMRMVEEAERELTFHPYVNPASRSLTAYLPDAFHPRQRLLQAEEERKEAARQRQREAEERAALTFHPALPPDLRREKAMEGLSVDPVYRLHDAGERRRHAWQEDDQLRRSARDVYRDCSFTPHINPTSALLARVHRGKVDAAFAVVSRASAPQPSTSGQPRLNPMSRLLCLSSGGLHAHEAKSAAFHRQLDAVYREKRERERAEEEEECTFAPETVMWDRGSAEVEMVVHGVDRFLEVRGWAAEQRRWKAAREREVFLLDAVEGPGRRGSTQPQPFALHTDRRGASTQRTIEAERAQRSNRVLT